jgi:hypothetical protein
MKQPRFKFGDKVKSKCTGDFFTIDKIQKLNDGIFVYYGKDYVHQHGCCEDVLELYQEPKKKKLYAYTTTRPEDSAEVRFFNSELPSRWTNFLPLPEYDLEYGEDKKEEGK